MNRDDRPAGEDALRRLLADEGQRYTPETHRAWSRIEARRSSRRRRIAPRSLAALSAAAAVLVAVLAVTTLGGDDGTDVQTGGAPQTAVTNPPVPPVVAEPAGPGIWPFTSGAEADASDSDRYDDPVETARAFLVDYLGFTRLQMGEFAAGDSRSGEVPATTRARGPVTTVLVRQLGESSRWTVIGAATPNIVLDRPGALDEITSPAEIAGRSTAFEGNVVVEVREDGNRRLGLTPLTGGSMGELGPLAGDVPFETPTAPGGAVVATTSSAEDGAMEEASVVRIRFAPPD